MDYFEQFDLPKTFLVDKNKLKEKFYALSRSLHPDGYLHSILEEQADILQQAAFLNKAYKTLSNPMQLLAYYLQIQGIIESNEKYALPNTFLMEMMELGEELEEAKLTNNLVALDSLKSKIKGIETQLETEVKELFENREQQNYSEQSLNSLKLYYYKKKYLANLSI